MKQKERMEKGLLYDPNIKEIMDEQASCLELLYEFNLTRPSEFKLRQELMKKMFLHVGKNCYIEPPLRSNFGGRHVYLGDNVYFNFNVTLVDDANIYIGNKVLIGPNVTIATANHPLDPYLRSKGLQYNKEVHIGDNVWIGANVTICPGVKVGENSVIGAGSVVTKDIPSNVLAFGNPCKVYREIDEHDKEFFYKNERIDYENIDFIDK